MTRRYQLITTWDTGATKKQSFGTIEAARKETAFWAFRAKGYKRTVTFKIIDKETGKEIPVGK